MSFSSEWLTLSRLLVTKPTQGCSHVLVDIVDTVLFSTLMKPYTDSSVKAWKVLLSPSNSIVV